MASSRGPKPTPANVHVLRGNPSKLPLSQLLAKDGTPRPDTEIPEPPQWLSAEARAEWGRITPQLEVLGLVSQIDRALLVAYCVEWGLYARTEAQLEALGEDGRIQETPSGYKQVSALWTIRCQALDRMARFAAEFGMSPSARHRVTASEPIGEQGELPGMEKPQEVGWGDL